MLCETSVLAGSSPFDFKNPWKYNLDGYFVTLKDKHRGEWKLEIEDKGNELIIMLRNYWKSNDGYAYFRLVELSDKHFAFQCTDSGYGFMKNWKIQSDYLNNDGGEKVVMKLSG